VLAEPEQVAQVVFLEDGAITYIRTGRYILTVRGNVEIRLEFILVGPDGQPLKLINGLVKLTASVRAIIDELNQLPGAAT